MVNESVMPCLMERSQLYRECQRSWQPSWQFPEKDQKITGVGGQTLADAELGPWIES